MKLAVSNKVIVPIKVTLKDNGQEKKYAFELVCDRVGEEEFQERIKDPETASAMNPTGVATNPKIRQVMREITSDWRGQNLVLNDDGTTADFCDEAFEMMLEMHGMLDAVTRSYMKEVGAKVKN